MTKHRRVAETTPVRIRVWWNPTLERFVATPMNGRWADELFATGETEAKAVESVLNGLDKEASSQSDEGDAGV